MVRIGARARKRPRADVGVVDEVRDQEQGGRVNAAIITRRCCSMRPAPDQHVAGHSRTRQVALSVALTAGGSEIVITLRFVAIIRIHESGR